MGVLHQVNVELLLEVVSERLLVLATGSHPKEAEEGRWEVRYKEWDDEDGLYAHYLRVPRSGVMKRRVPM